MKSIIPLFLVLFATTSFAQTRVKKTSTVEIQTSAVCDMCEDLIVQKNLAFEKGIKYAEIDITTGVLTVNFRKDKTSAAQIRKLISKLGYCADSVKADSLAHENLHFCCKKPCEGEK